MNPSSSRMPTSGDENNNSGNELSIEAVRAIVAPDEKRGEISVMSSDDEEESEEPVSRPSGSEAVVSTVSDGQTGRALEDALQETQLYSLIATCSDPVLIPELLSELSFLHLRPDEYPFFLEHVAAFHGRMEAVEVPVSVMRDLSKFLRGHFCKYRFMF